MKHPAMFRPRLFAAIATATALFATWSSGLPTTTAAESPPSAAPPAAHSTHTGGPRVAAASASWPVAGHDLANSRSNRDEDVIAPGNVTALRERWSQRLGGEVAATPAVADGAVYVPDLGGTMWSFDARTGDLRWKHAVSDYTGLDHDYSRATPAVADGRLIFGDSSRKVTTPDGAHMLAVDSATGTLLWNTIVDPNPVAVITGAPTVDDNTVYVGVSADQEGKPSCCTWRGSVVALDATTGKVLWRTRTAPRPYTGASVWSSSPVVDHTTGLLYVGTGNNYSVPDGICTYAGEKDCTPHDPQDYVDSVLALDLTTGQPAWVFNTLDADVSSYVCDSEDTCGPDFDFASDPNLFIATIDGEKRQLLGIGQKSGIYWAIDAATGALVWQTRVGPGGELGGVQWGSATDGKRIYVAESDSENEPYQLQPSGDTVSRGSIAALDPATGEILWQTADPQGDSLGAKDTGFVSTANGVVYAASDAAAGPNMFALDARTGKILWSHASGGAVIGGAAIVNHRVFWGSGYHFKTCPDGKRNCPTTNTLYAFALRPLPDLVVTSIKARPAHPRSGNRVLFRATVRNRGRIATPRSAIIRVAFAVDGKRVSWSDNHRHWLAAGASVTLTANSGPSGVPTWKATAGHHAIRAYVDDRQRIPEGHEDNNTRSRSLTVRPRTR